MNSRLDVTDILLDPDFVDDSMVCESNTQTMSSGGIATNTPQLTPFSGVVTQGNGDIMKRQPDGSRIAGSILIITKFNLTDGLAGRDADIVQWNGRRYTVSAVNNYTTYGAGFVEAVCDLIPLSGG